MSKIEFVDCLPDVHWSWREQPQSLFENLKHNKINGGINVTGGSEVRVKCVLVMFTRIANH
jgi:hypothetical protein